MNFGERLKRHIEEYCGTSPSKVIFEETLGVRVFSFVDTPTSGLDTSVTIGLSGHLLDQGGGGSIRQELVSSVDQKYNELPWHQVLLSAGKILLSQHTAFLLGQVLGPAGPIFPEAPWCKATALLCSPPAFFDSDFDEFEFDGIATVFVELTPITTAEAEWIKRHGWSKFFERVNNGEIDILDLSRN